MTRGDLPGWRLFDRPVKPVAGGAVVLMVTLMVVNVANIGVLASTMVGDVVAAMASMAAAALLAGWWGRWQPAAEAGLLLTCLCYILQAAFVALTVGPLTERVWTSAGAAVVAGGAFLLEAWDERV